MDFCYQSETCCQAAHARGQSSRSVTPRPQPAVNVFLKLQLSRAARRAHVAAASCGSLNHRENISPESQKRQVCCGGSSCPVLPPSRPLLFCPPNGSCPVLTDPKQAPDPVTIILRQRRLQLLLNPGRVQCLWLTAEDSLCVLGRFLWDPCTLAVALLLILSHISSRVCAKSNQ